MELDDRFDAGSDRGMSDLSALPNFDAKMIVAARQAYQPQSKETSLQVLWEHVTAMALEIERLNDELRKLKSE